MILVLRADGTAALEQAEDFARFHLEIDAALSNVETARISLSPLAQLDSREVAWVDRDALFALARGATNDDKAWVAKAQAMLAKAARYGWVRDKAPSIKSHIVWRCGTPAFPQEQP